MFHTGTEGHAVAEAGPFDLARPGPLRRLAMRAPDPEALVVVASKSHRDAATDAYIARYKVADLRSAGSSLKFCLLAAGEADLYPRLGRTMEWDTAAGDAVLRAAGGEVLDFETGAALRYGKPGYANPFFIARHPDIPLQGE
jgi:3'(2'), 5'-bisphosphate nucleotidase